MKKATSLTVHAVITLVATVFLASSARAQTDATLPALGGGGGRQFIARCQQGQLLNGFDLTYGDDVDAIRPLCVAAYAPSRAGTVEPYPQRFGGVGGSPNSQMPVRLASVRLVCPRESPIVIGMFVRWEGDQMIVVNSIHLYCGMARPTQTRGVYPTVVFDANTGEWAGNYRQDCPAGLVGVGITGRSGKSLDSVGLICGAPKVTRSVL
jgi:hypothetical protein